MTLGFVVVLADFKINPTMVSQEVLHHYYAVQCHIDFQS